MKFLNTLLCVLIIGLWVIPAPVNAYVSNPPIKYEYWNTGGDSGSANITSANMTYQTFTTNTTAPHSITSVRLSLRKNGYPGSVYLGIQNTTANTTGPDCLSYPTGSDIATAVLSATVSDSYDWYTFTMTEEVCLSANTTYAIVVRVPETTTTDCIFWQSDAGGGFTGGNAGKTQDGGITWSNNCPVDQLFEIWGNLCLEISDAKVFSSYTDSGDWLITILYKNLYPPYYEEAKDVSSLFVFQLYDATTSTVIAQTKCFEWGYKPGAIYLSANGVIPLQWGAAYRVRLYGLFNANPYAEYILKPTDWMGSDLSRLDNWVRSTASLMEKYYNTSLTTYLEGKGIVLNSAGGVIFANDIPQLSVIRPNLFSIVTATSPYVQGTYSQAYQDTLVWQVMMGPQLTLAFTAVGNTVGVSGATVGSWLGFMIYALVALFCFRPGHAIAAMVVPVPILIIAFGTGLAELALMGILLAAATILLSWQVWWKGG